MISTTNRLLNIVATTTTATTTTTDIFLLTLLLLLLTTPTTLVLANVNLNAPFHHPPPAVVVDLSQDLEEHIDHESPGAIRVATTAASHPKIKSTIVLEHGKIVASYCRDDNDRQCEQDAVVADVAHPIWSITKSWTSLLIGLLIQQDDELLTLDTTLGDIFGTTTPDDNDNESSSSSCDRDIRNKVTLNDPKRVSYLQDVTIEQLLTMTSGLLDPAPWDINIDLDHGGTAGGGTLVGALEYPLIENDDDSTTDKSGSGVFSYLGVSNILSYVIKERTGLSPKQYAISKHVFASLGIGMNNDDDDDVITWWQNNDGIEYSYHGMALTALQMAKFGQLYLQQGLVAPNKPPLVSSEWIVNSTSVQVEAVMHNPFSNQTIVTDYGYLFWLWNGTKHLGDPNVGDFYCAIGYGGQDICVSPRLDRVCVQQRDYEDGMGNLIMAAVTFDETLSFGTNKSSSAVQRD